MSSIFSTSNGDRTADTATHTRWYRPSASLCLPEISTATTSKQSHLQRSYDGPLKLPAGQRLHVKIRLDALDLLELPVDGRVLRHGLAARRRAHRDIVGADLSRYLDDLVLVQPDERVVNGKVDQVVLDHEVVRRLRGHLPQRRAGDEAVGALF